MASEVCLVLHRKSANEPAVKAAVKYVRAQGIDLRVRIPWNKKDKPRVVREALADGAKRIIAGGGHHLRHDPRGIAVLFGWLDRQRHLLISAYR